MRCGVRIHNIRETKARDYELPFVVLRLSPSNTISYHPILFRQDELYQELRVQEFWPCILRQLDRIKADGSSKRKV